MSKKENKFSLTVGQEFASSDLLIGVNVNDYREVSFSAIKSENQTHIPYPDYDFPFYEFLLTLFHNCPSVMNDVKKMISDIEKLKVNEND